MGNISTESHDQEIEQALILENNWENLSLSTTPQRLLGTSLASNELRRSLFNIRRTPLDIPLLLGRAMFETVLSASFRNSWTTVISLDNSDDFSVCVWGKCSYIGIYIYSVCSTTLSSVFLRDRFCHRHSSIYMGTTSPIQLQSRIFSSTRMVHRWLRSISLVVYLKGKFSMALFELWTASILA